LSTHNLLKHKKIAERSVSTDFYRIFQLDRIGHMNFPGRRSRNVQRQEIVNHAKGCSPGGVATAIRMRTEQLVPAGGAW
jgi:hypothetical protein